VVIADSFLRFILYVSLPTNTNIEVEMLEAFNFLQHTPNSLTKLKFSSVEMSAEAIKCITSSLNHPNFNIKRLDFSSNTQITVEAMKYFCEKMKANTPLRYLRFSNVHIGDEGAEYMANYLSTLLSPNSISRLVI